MEGDLYYSVWGVIEDDRISTLLSGIHICPECFRLVGPLPPERRQNGRESRWQERFQSCGHRPDPSVTPGSPRVVWPGYDYNEAVCLCRCCGLTPLWSGIRWSVWFCSPCMQLIGQLHALCKRYVIPIGRHSFMSGYGVRDPGEPGLFGPLTTDRDVRRVFRALKKLFSSMDVLFSWYTTVMPWNLSDLGFKRGSEVSLVDYTRKAIELQPDFYARFLGLCDRYRILNLGDAAPATRPPARKRRKAS